MNRAVLRSELRRLAFTPAIGIDAPPRIGVEVEMLPIDAAARTPSPIGRHNASLDMGVASLDWLRPLAMKQGWIESRTSKGAPCFMLDDGSTIGFEPGGQIEYSSAPSRSPSALIRRTRSVIARLRSAADAVGVALLHVGVDPVTPIERTALELEQRRYIEMDAYLGSRGDAGRRMMRQTAATQVAVDLGGPTVMLDRWRLLNAAAPSLIAAFANSPRYAARDTGHRSFRCHIWRTLDPTRTGVVGAGTEPVEEYLEFALRAPALFHAQSMGEYRPFGELAARGLVDAHDWDEHLSTLFPEVRPRGYFEVRSVDAVPLEWLPAVVGVIAGIAYDARTGAAALDLLPDPTPSALVSAGRDGLGDPAIASVARDLLTLGLEGCERLGLAFVDADHVEEMRMVVEERIASGASPDGRLADEEARSASRLLAL
jgi:glutamate--cysteine ligase